MVVPVIAGGFTDESFSTFTQELSTAFRRPHIQEHFQKLARTNTPEQHLFIPLHNTALPVEISSALMFSTALPTAPPPIPTHITHLWLAPEYSSRILLWSRGQGWRNV